MMRCSRPSMLWSRARRLAGPSGRPDSCGISWKPLFAGNAISQKESVLGTDVFGRPASWNPRLDPVVRQEAARLRKRLANYYETSGAEAEVRIELPLGGYKPLFRRKTVEIGTAPMETPRVKHDPARRRVAGPSSGLCRYFDN